MKNYKKSDLNFFKDNFSKFEKLKHNVIIDPTVPHTYSTIKEKLSKSYLYELGYKKAYTYLSTDSHENKCIFVDLNLFFEKKYVTMYPKCNILGPKQDKNFTKHFKKIGDISFEEEIVELENVKNLFRQPPDNITEEWVRENLNNNVEVIRFENCYWLSKDIISKIGRLDENIKELSLRNLDIDNLVLTNILNFARNIEFLDISYCNGLTVGICQLLKIYCSKLKSLKVFSMFLSINDEGLESLGGLESLTDLDIGLCSNITDKGLINFSTNKIQKLTSINLTGLLKITNLGIQSIINANNSTLTKITISLMPQKTVDGDICGDISKCKNLNFLDISGCNYISNDAAGNLFSPGFESLNSLNLSGLPINDSVAENCLISNKLLKILRLSNCKDISNSLLDYIVMSGHGLLLLEINRTKKIDDSKIKETILKKSPHFRIIRTNNIHWDPKNNGLKIPLIHKDYIKPQVKGAKGAAKKNDDKNPVAQLKKILDERKPKRPTDFKV